MLPVDLKHSTFIFFIDRESHHVQSGLYRFGSDNQPRGFVCLFDDIAWQRGFVCQIAQYIKAEDGKVNTALPATKLKKQTNDTVFPGTAQNMVTNIKEKGPSKRREPIVVFIGHSDSEETSEIELPDLPNLSPRPSLV